MRKLGSKDDILRAATGIIAFEGIDKLTMGSLSEELGMAKGSLYHWYPSKEAILEEMFQWGHEKLMEKGFTLSLKGSALEILTKAFSAWAELFSSDDLLPYLRAVYALKWTDERAGEEERSIRLMVEGQMEIIMERLGQTEFLSSLSSALLLSKLQSILEGEAVDAEALALSFSRLLEGQG